MMVWFSYLMITHNLDIVPSFICVILRKSQNTRQLHFYKGQSYQKNFTEQGDMYLPHPLVTLKVWPVTVNNDFVFCMLLHTFHI